MSTACTHTRTFEINARCKDMCSITLPDGKQSEGYVPRGLGIGGGDYVQLSICVDCKTVVGLPDTNDLLEGLAELFVSDEDEPT